jgi:hypothetical protein
MYSFSVDPEFATHAWCRKALLANSKYLALGVVMNEGNGLFGVKGTKTVIHPGTAEFVGVPWLQAPAVDVDAEDEVESGAMDRNLAAAVDSFSLSQNFRLLSLHPGCNIIYVLPASLESTLLPPMNCGVCGLMHIITVITFP